jgi:hypothetical protein
MATLTIKYHYMTLQTPKAVRKRGDGEANEISADTCASAGDVIDKVHPMG